jgi:hypothetical protein
LASVKVAGNFFEQLNAFLEKALLQYEKGLLFSCSSSYMIMRAERPQCLPWQHACAET